MTSYLIGDVATTRGLAIHDDGRGERTFTRQRTEDFALRHRRDLPLLVRHDEGWQLGSVVHLEKSRGQMLVVAELTAHGVDVLESGTDPWYLSAGTNAAEYDDHGTRARAGASLYEVSVTTTPAHVGLTPVVWGEGFPHRRANLMWEDTWNRGVEAAAVPHHRQADPHWIDVYDELTPLLAQRRTPTTTVAADVNHKRNPIVTYNDRPIYDVPLARALVDGLGLEVLDDGTVWKP